MLFSHKYKEREGDLEKALHQVSRVEISPQKKAEIKTRLLSAIKLKDTHEHFGFVHLVRKTKQVALEVSPNPYFSSVLKEKIVTVIDFQSRSFAERFARFFRTHQKVGAGFMVTLLVSSLILNFTIAPENVEAGYRTSLEDVMGNVTVLRDGELIKGTSQFMLHTNDVVQTSPGAYAVIRYLDQSLTRLDENTELKISKLFINPDNSASTVVEIVLAKGRIWTRVVNLIDKTSQFLVHAQNTVAIAKNRVAFNVNIVEDARYGNRVRIVAVDNQLDVKVSTNQKVVTTTLLGGYSSEATKSSQTTSISVVTDEDKEWVAKNIEKDDQYIVDVKEESKQQRLEQGSNTFTRAAESTKLALTFDDFDKQMQLLDAAIKKLPNAELAIANGRSRHATLLLEDFQKELKVSYEWIKKYDLQYPLKANALKRKMNQLLGEVEKKLALLLPDDPEYSVKKAVLEAKVAVSGDSLERIQNQLATADTLLADARELLKKGDKKGAQLQVEKYNETINTVAADIKDVSSEDKDGVVNALLQSKATGLKTLESLSDTSSLSINKESIGSIEKLDAENFNQDLQKSLSEAKATTMETIGAALIQSQKESGVVSTLETIKSIEGSGVNGKQSLDVQVYSSGVTVISGDDVVKVRPSAEELLAK